jgi:hypothetical protein
MYPTAVFAQSDTLASRAEGPACLRFKFGAWAPALDWKRSGHPSAPDSVQVPRSASGQAWAVGMTQSPTVAAGDTSFVLYPGFWPAGVTISFDPRAFASRDTVTGTARALVADGRQPSSTARAIVWRVSCG